MPPKGKIPPQFLKNVKKAAAKKAKPEETDKPNMPEAPTSSGEPPKMRGKPRKAVTSARAKKAAAVARARKGS